jgi:hypothetical protein
MSFLKTLFGKQDTARNEQRSMKAPVDLNKPIENPKLSAAIDEFAEDHNEKTEQELTRQLRSAMFLVPMLTDEMHTTAGADTGDVTIEKGSVIKMLSCIDDAGAEHLPLFTDWPAIRAWTDEPVSTLVMPARDAWDFVLSQDHYAGAVVNPGGSPLPVGRSLIERLCVAATPR